MLYDGALKFMVLRYRLMGMEAGAAASSIARAVAIVNYLHSILDDSHNPELVAQLGRMYMRWCGRLPRRTSVAIRRGCNGHSAEIEEMRGAWVEVPPGRIRTRLNRIFSVPILDGTRSPPGK